MRLSELRAMEQTIKVDFRDQPLEFRYYPARFTPDVAEMFQGTDRPFQMSVEFLSKVLVDAGLTDDEDKLLPADVEVVKMLPAGLVDDIIGAIFEDMKPGETNGATSPAGSLQKVK